MLTFFGLSSSIEVRDNYLRFTRIAPADEGRYVCTASNNYGNTTKVAEVIVNSMHKKYNLAQTLDLTDFISLVNPPQEDTESYERTKEAYEGDTVSLSCSDDNPRGHYSRVNFDNPMINLTFIFMITNYFLQINSSNGTVNMRNFPHLPKTVKMS